MGVRGHRPGSSHWLSILGIGEEGIAGLGAAARALIGQAELVVGGARHIALASSLIAGERMVWPRPIGDGVAAIAARRGWAVVVLASGDPFFHGVGSLLARHFSREEYRCVPVASCVSLAAARLGWALQEVIVVSCCGHPVGRVAAHLYAGARLMVLSADETTPGAVMALLRARGFGESRVYVMEALGGARERVREVGFGVMPGGIDRLNLLAIEVAGAGNGVGCVPGLPDDAFAHDGQITKAEIRAVTLAALSPRPGDLLWDVGCGSGSVGIEFLRAHPRNRVVAVERDGVRAARARENAAALGVGHYEVVVGEAPGALAGLAVPDAVFIGGGAGDEVIGVGWQALRAGGRMVVNAVTIETEAALFAAHRRFGGRLTRLGVERLDRVGRMHGFRPGMTVTQWRGVKG
ncbi:precorrin-6y C5,15-methyltransferase (decarboxylating) subunit CbiE [Acidiphilium acidophilum]|uniref:precorrin-6y C5,15-methyltransferase (decarboxylating) subunit CbiE n=1 Tax=Acidiphilium acidophilum TaxID=76588 RepID=UPI0029CA6CF9|nr:precorrin-6y C5,15-methyltransferase (decarboxylating) subunit CbiE [Acidiphilium acidophilum]